MLEHGLTENIHEFIEINLAIVVCVEAIELLFKVKVKEGCAFPIWACQILDPLEAVDCATAILVDQFEVLLDPSVIRFLVVHQPN